MLWKSFFIEGFSDDRLITGWRIVVISYNLGRNLLTSAKYAFSVTTEKIHHYTVPSEFNELWEYPEALSVAILHPG